MTAMTFLLLTCCDKIHKSYNTLVHYLLDPSDILHVVTRPNNAFISHSFNPFNTQFQMCQIRELTLLTV